MTSAPAPRSPSRSPLIRRKVSPERTSEKDTERRVTFADEAPPKKDGHTKMQMPVSEARKKTPRKPNETKKAWKDRIFQTARGQGGR